MKRGGDSRIRVKNVPKASYALSSVHLELRTLVGSQVSSVPRSGLAHRSKTTVFDHRVGASEQCACGFGSNLEALAAGQVIFLLR